ncbi:tetratricopeptide repeat protein [Neisseria chenwenguii]|uniref:Uncharacterized protein n=1 Tax=Neisseria chenwenguii TaxID=1853278 RepID=A0A220S2R9_9NEIS|nr:tetratricopeptide repeat protein [Neisseria chenwenguii]ASK27770.1 hypothetical protein BG910_08495 [Neisseria chenwenguii]ROV56510.1 sel1 repeat family protein [Neisseria chenwenguii]
MKRIAAILLIAVLSACSANEQAGHKQAAAERGITSVTMEWLLENGEAAYVQHDYNQAMTLFTQASAAGSTAAPRYIGLMYLNGYGVKKNARRAVAELNKAAVKGDAAAQYWLAYCYEQGIGTERDYDEAVKWYLSSANQGESAAAPAMTALGRLAESKEESEGWYRKAAAAGGKEAQAALSYLASQ